MRDAKKPTLTLVPSTGGGKPAGSLTRSLTGAARMVRVPKTKHSLECPLCLSTGGLGGHAGIGASTFLLSIRGPITDGNRVYPGRHSAGDEMFCPYCLASGKPGMDGKPGKIGEFYDRGWHIMKPVKK